jgi:hypothetical protein
MSTGTFVLLIREPKKTAWGTLEQSTYDDASAEKNERREARLEDLKGRASGWSSRYESFRDAEFRIVEESFSFKGKRVVFGTPFEKEKV